MDEDNKNIEEDQDYPENFDDTFEIGMPIEDTLSTLEKNESPENKTDTITDVETDFEPDTEPEIETEQEAGDVLQDNFEGDVPDDEQDIPDNFDDTFDIDDTLNSLKNSDFPDDKTGIKTDIETDADPIETGQKAGDVQDNFEEDVPDDENSETTAFDEIKDRLTELSQSFESKLKYDEHKNKIIDDLHKSLQEFRDGLVKKYLHRFITDIIKIIDDIRKFTSHHKDQPPSEETTEKLLKYIENISSDLEDLFSWEGVEPFTCDGDRIDTSRQRILNKIETDDPEKDKTVAERLRPGYEWDGKVIRPEMVSAYIYQKESTAEDNNNS
jgi:molecular chaperone GrpE (heat shock protein)